MRRRRPATISPIVALTLLAGAAAAPSARSADPATPTAPRWTTPERVDAALRDAARTLRLSPGGELVGPGADLLREEAAAADFFLIGEDHLTRETPVLSAALAAAIAPLGYGTLIVETGPVTARRVVDTLRAGGADALATLVARHAWSVPFYDHEEEAALLVAALAEGYEVVGVDQEFVGAGPLLMEELLHLAEADARPALLDLAPRVRGLPPGGPAGSGPPPFLLAPGDDLERLRAAAAAIGPAGVRVVEEIAESAAIYRLHADGASYESNRRRVARMKRNLVDALRRDESARAASGAAPARVLMKLGAWHLGRGRSPVDQFDLGNFANELGAWRGSGSFHLRPMALRSSTSGVPRRTIDQSPELEPLLEAAADALDADLEADWVVADLRPLRPLLHRAADRKGREALAALAWSYDAVAVTRAFTAPTRLAPAAGPAGD